MINKDYGRLSIRRQCELLSINRSGLYVKKVLAADESEICQLIAEIYERNPVYGYRRITAMLKRQGISINSKRVRRLMKEMGLEAIYPGPNTSKRNHKEAVMPYLLKGLKIVHPGQVWQVDITYLRMEKGFMYLAALIDVYSRLVVGYSISNSLDSKLVLRALEIAISNYGIPKIINSDQGSQFTGEDWKKELQGKGIKISMTGKGRSNDNGYVERLWRTLKYEGIILHELRTVVELKDKLPGIISWYNTDRPHQSLDYLTPMEVYDECMENSGLERKLVA